MGSYKKHPVADQRSMALQRVGLEFLARSDFEAVSISKIAKEANCSVGAFYYRYEDKNAYLRQLIASTFRGLENRLQNRLSNSGSQISLSEFVTCIITKLGTPENVGVIRAALKLGATDSDALRPYERYRESVYTTAENIFRGGSKRKLRPKEIREALQIVFAAINDAAMMPESAAMKLGSDEMSDSLCSMAANHVGANPDFKGKITQGAVVAGNEPDETPAIKEKDIGPNRKKSKPRQRGKVTLL